MVTFGGLIWWLQTFIMLLCIQNILFTDHYSFKYHFKYYKGVIFRGKSLTWYLCVVLSCDEETEDPELKAQREKERRQANNARER